MDLLTRERLKRLSSFFLLFLAAGFWFMASAQEVVLKGQVKDNAGLPLKGVSLTLLDLQRGHKFTIKTAKDGKFFKIGLPPSQYRLTAELEGYLAYEQELAVVFGGEYDLEITLKKELPKLEQDVDFQAGLDYFKQGDYARAVVSFEKAVQRYPESSIAYYNLGISAVRNGHKYEGRVYLEKATSLNPRMSEVYLALAEVYFSEGDWDGARRAAEDAINLEPGNPKGYYNLGLIIYKSGRMGEALDSFLMAIKLDPGFSSAYYQAGLAYVAENQFKKALNCFEKFLELEPEAPEADRVKAMIEELKKQIK